MQRSSFKQKEKWAKVLVMEMTSSDESDGEVIQVKDLPWRSSKVTEFINNLERGMETHLSEQAQRQTKQRVLGGVSSRPDHQHLWHHPGHFILD